jgi:ADP-heptose:LPS heptosyltransferase
MQVSTRADAARDARRFRDAAILYEQAVDLWPERVGNRVQAGHMFKEAGDRGAAERHYLAAALRRPADADLALQLGHFYKTGGQPVEAAAQYRRALDLDPALADAARELAQIEVPASTAAEPDALIVGELLPARTEAALPAIGTIELRRLGGRRDRSAWGALPHLFGIEAIRGVCIAQTAFSRVELRLDGALVHAETPLATDMAGLGLVKHVFNLWVDLSAVPPGLHSLEIAMRDGTGTTVRRQDHVVIGAPAAERDHPDSDGIVEIDPADPRPLEAQIRGRASMVRPPARSALPQPVRSILVLRADQLGDMVVSVPALRRLRTLFPDARIVGVLTQANVDLARSLGLFDETITVDFPDDPGQRHRVMTQADQTALRARLAPYTFDIAIDLSASAMSRPLLRLSGARFLYGFDKGDRHWLSAGFEGGMRDPANGLDAAPQSGRIRGLIEVLGAIADSGAATVRRGDLDPARLADFGIEAHRYAVLHMGARLAFTGWTGYPALARELLDRTDLSLVLLADDPATRDGLAPDLLASDRVRLVDRRLDFDDFDALLSFCAVFVGNDSGPKHLASLRGVPVVSLHSARLNWSEWGQEIGGAIVSRRVPCAGCALHYDSDECGKGYACIADIRVAEVLDAVLAELRG